jgi:hypothetical protein
MSNYATTADEFITRIKPYQEQVSIIISDASAKQLLLPEDIEILKKLYGLDGNVFYGKTQIRTSLKCTDALMDKRLAKIWSKLAGYQDCVKLRSCLNNLLRCMPDSVRYAVKV